MNAQEFQGESVEYDSEGNRFFTNSDGNAIIQRASDGTLSYFGVGTRSSYGMEVMNGYLFTIDGQRIYMYDLETEQEVTNVLISGAGFLNGMGSDSATNRVWVSDFSNQRIYELDFTDVQSVQPSMIVSDTQGTPNGVWHDQANDRLLYVTWGGNASIMEVDLLDNTVDEVLNTGLGNIDGIDEDNQGRLYISSWSPTRITRYSEDLTSSETITAPGINNPADICYALEIDTLAIPNGSTDISFVGFSANTIDEFDEFESVLFPNPVSSVSLMTFELDTQQKLRLDILDGTGRLVKNISEDNYPSGSNRVLIDSHGLNAGHYFISIRSEGYMSIKRMVVI